MSSKKLLKITTKSILVSEMLFTVSMSELRVVIGEVVPKERLVRMSLNKS